MSSFVPGTKWKGRQVLTQGKEKWSITASKIVVTTSFHGPYADCKTQRPNIGQVITGYPGLYCTQAELVEEDGGKGHIDVTLEAMQATGSFNFAPLGPPVYEVEFSEITRPLEQHSRCGKLKSDRTPNAVTGKKLTWEDWQLLTDSDYDSTGNGSGIWASTAKWDLATYQAMKARGQDSYVLYAPILRRTTIHLTPPADVGSASGRLQTPPSGGFDLSDWDWLAGPDRCTENTRIFTRTTEWHGADYWDTDTYSH